MMPGIMNVLDLTKMVGVAELPGNFSDMPGNLSPLVARQCWLIHGGHGTENVPDTTMFGTVTRAGQRPLRVHRVKKSAARKASACDRLPALIMFLRR